MTKRFRMIAGPNGSGKSTLISELKRQGIALGIYLNADEIEKFLTDKFFLKLDDYSLKLTQSDFTNFIKKHSGIKTKLEDTNLLNDIEITRNILKIKNRSILEQKSTASYLAALITEFFRHELLNNGLSFTIETVMSHPSKVEFMQRAKAKDYKTYLYFLATKDPQINIDRVNMRVRKGEHSVPEEKIRDRYFKSLKLMFSAVKETDRAYILDNSQEEMLYIAEINQVKDLNFKVESIPLWVNKYLKKYYAP